ncbi:tripartite tricarboxylate transporter substrate binding protein [Siccirubricoccus sp. KC 17139]|uniref:Tripartite tricarboxylate transporter substrate binding protein n=1 Tax=Siccirubricoccus soli TaxID=2899147 RepID=A0ABT1D6I0_9PROT|nr:tripartite tricarboxylate transporter substrate binding protein [Siccirubricoccus soli]MCO6416804.1 tripartite tricarboxylate transporter substrate binding protein [Siccirubricoccus soli]MCP2682939.1 tripartite tricarboxylate transporter substrate binding protein [Siccirubricoccus soli]
MKRLLFALLLLLAALPARAQDFPSRDVRIICGFAPGGTCDLLTRLLAEHLSPIFKVNVVAENRTGASGMIAADTVAKAAPDGHTVGLATMAMHTILPVMPGIRMPFDVDRDLTPIANVANIYNVLVANPNGPFRTIPELIAYAKANPGKLSYASAGNGSSQHLAAELFLRQAGIELLHVPYRGGAPAIVDIVAGRTDMMFGNLPEFMGQIRDGGLRAVAFGAPRPSPLLPGVPMISATLPEFSVRNWFGIAGPGKLPKPVLDRWVAALRQVAADPVFQRRMVENGMEVIVDDPDSFASTIAQDRQRWGEVIRQANIRAD